MYRPMRRLWPIGSCEPKSSRAVVTPMRQTFSSIASASDVHFSPFCTPRLRTGK